MKQRRLLKSQTIWGELFDYLLNFIGYLLISMLIVAFLGIILNLFNPGVNDDKAMGELTYFISPIIILLVFLKKPIEKSYFKLSIKDIAIGSFLGFVFVFLVYFSILIFQKLHVKIGGQIDWFMVFYYTFMLFNAALLEELLIRGILLEIFIKKNLIWVGILFSSFVWALFHIGNNGFNVLSLVNIFFIGIFFSFIYVKKKNLTLVTFLHFSWNLTLGIILGSNVSGMAFLPKIITVTIPNTKNILITGGKFGIEASIVTGLIFLVINLFFIFKVKIRKDFSRNTI